MVTREVPVYVERKVPVERAVPVERRVEVPVDRVVERVKPARECTCTFNPAQICARMRALRAPARAPRLL